MQPPSTPLPRTPLGLALILARSVSFDQDGVLTIIQPYARAAADSFPVTYLSMEVYAALTECDGDVLVEVRLIDAADALPPVFRQLQSAHFDGPQEVCELVFHQFNVTIPAVGGYRLQMFVHGPGPVVQGSGVFVLERRLVVEQATERLPPEEMP
jgi:hypothetical protein